MAEPMHKRHGNPTSARSSRVVLSISRDFDASGKGPAINPTPSDVPAE